MPVMSIEVFLSARGVVLSVPVGCGLNQADTLRVNPVACSLEAVRRRSVLPLDLPRLSGAHCAALLAAGVVSVGEFLPQGVAGAYQLEVVAAD